jgi:Zn-dependent M28 family amino/carboxypeptidase
VRFVLFNAEEHGLVGSRAYAAAQASVRARIVGVFQMDMVGYNARPPYTFEIHVGADSPDVQERSRLLAERLASVAPMVAPLLDVPQIYDSTGPPEKHDPAQGRSDHASFHDYGYAACAVSEDYFAGPTEQSPAPDGTPHYHQRSDTAATVDAELIGAIARAVAAAAWSVQSLGES